MSSATRHTSENLNTAHYNYEHSISPEHTSEHFNTTHPINEKSKSTEHTNTINKTFNLAYKCSGVKTRMKSVEFYNFINNYDVILMTESKLDKLDQITFPGFKLITKNRRPQAELPLLSVKKYKVECLLLTTHNKIPFG